MSEVIYRGNSRFDGDVEYVPIVWDDGRVGYEVNCDYAPEGRPRTFLYFNPSDSDGPGDENVFIYMGEQADPVDDYPICFVNVEFGSVNVEGDDSDEYREVPQEAMDLARIANNIEDDELAHKRLDDARAAAQDDPRGERDR